MRNRIEARPGIIFLVRLAGPVGVPVPQTTPAGPIAARFLQTAMPRYFFDIHDGIVVRDEDGMVLYGLTEARAQAMHLAAAYAGKPEMLGSDGGAIVVTVRSDATNEILAIRLAFVVDTQ